MRIAVNTRFLIKNKLEGIGWFTFETMKRITQNHPEHEFIFLFDRDWDEDFIFSNNITPIKVWPPARHPYLWKYWFDYALPPVLKKVKPDVFLSTDGFLSLKSNVPTVLVIHDLGFESYPEHTPGIVSKFYRRFTPLYAHKAKKIITVSEFSKSDIMKRYKIDPAKIEVVFNGANERFVPLDEQVKTNTRIHYADGKNYFLYVGSIHPRKNINKLLAAFDVFKNETKSDMQLVIAGRMAWKTEETKMIYEAMQNKNAVLFTGHLQMDSLTKVVGAADALVFPSFFEGFGIPVVEARYCNVPVLCSNTSSLPEVAGENAIFFDPHYEEDIKLAMMRFLEKKNNYRNENDAVIARRQFNWDIAAQKIAETVFNTVKQTKSVHSRVTR
ncbi:MAG: glycosyltransferase family 4 protein [Chitinophagales bacterium]